VLSGMSAEDMEAAETLNSLHQSMIIPAIARCSRHCVTDM
jgi:hypothetical protein